ncbi:hypothetical protein ACX3O0_01960 [Homoserinimonas sp. A447]
MRFVAAIVSFVIAFGLIGLGIAQRTVFAEPDRATSEVTVKEAAPITIIDGSALNARDGRQKLEIGDSFDDKVFAAYGRSGDLVAWAGDTSYNHVTYDSETSQLTSELVKGSTDEAIAPEGSDLWIGEYTSEGSLEFTVNVPQDVSVIVMTDGVEPAPSELAVTWAVDNRAPWSGPLLIGGVLFLLLGLGLYLWALAHLRKTRGPRRKSPKPPSQPKLPSKPRYNYRKATKAVRGKPKAIENPRGRRSAGRMTVALPVVLVSAIVLSGCSVEDLPDFITGRTVENVPTPSATAMSTDELLQTPAVTVSQLEGIVERISTVAAQADTDRDPELAKTRFTGAALQLREANYAIRTVDNSIEPPPAIPAGPVELTLPQQSDVWPRTVFTVIQKAAEPEAPTATDAPVEEAPAEETPAEPVEPAVIPTALMLVQETPREPYKVAYAVVLEANAVLPDLAAATVGAVRQDPANKMLRLPPGQLATAYADVMMLGPKSEYYELFDYEGDALLPGVGAEAKAARAEALSTTTLEYSTTEGVGQPIAMASLNSGAIVTVSISELETAKPKEAGSILSPEKATAALSGVTKTTNGVSATYAYQLLFYVPPAASSDQIVLLGFSENLVAAKEL